MRRFVVRRERLAKQAIEKPHQCAPHSWTGAIDIPTNAVRERCPHAMTSTPPSSTSQPRAAISIAAIAPASRGASGACVCEMVRLESDADQLGHRAGRCSCDPRLISSRPAELVDAESRVEVEVKAPDVLARLRGGGEIVHADVAALRGIGTPSEAVTAVYGTCAV